MSLESARIKKNPESVRKLSSRQMKVCDGINRDSSTCTSENLMLVSAPGVVNCEESMNLKLALDCIDWEVLTKKCRVMCNFWLD